MSKPLKRVLIANRGEVVVRVAQTARRMNIESIGVYSDADRAGPWLESVDLAVALGGNSPGESYLDIDRVIAAAVASGADAIHPGYGFLAENAEFAERVAASGLLFVGPSPQSIRSMGSKLEAKQVARSLGVPTLAEHQVTDELDLDGLDELGLRYPLLLKAGAGGGGIGIRRVDAAEGLQNALELSRREARSAFGDPSVYIEEYLPRARHVEVQVVGDGEGNAVHLFERECSVQRRHQKLIEECPATDLDDAVRMGMYEAALAMTRHIRYSGAGTVEFLVRGQDFYFIEMNTRLQVEHCVTEEVTGVDLVQLQLEVASGAGLRLAQDRVHQSGHSIEARLCAEIPDNDFRPATGLVALFDAPRLSGVRYELGVATGHRVSPYYDSMIAKVIATGSDRDAARRLLAAALANIDVHGVETNRLYLRRILEADEFAGGGYDTTFVDSHPELARRELRPARECNRDPILALLAIVAERRGRSQGPATFAPGWRNVASHRSRLRLSTSGGIVDLEYVLDSHLAGKAWIDGTASGVRLLDRSDHRIAVEIDGTRAAAAVTVSGDRVHVSTRDADEIIRVLPRFAEASAETTRPGAIAPLPGLVVEVLVAPGDRVIAGEVLVRLEAMKMVHEIVAPFDGVVVDVPAKLGTSVDVHDVLVVVEPDEGGAAQAEPARPDAQ